MRARTSSRVMTPFSTRSILESANACRGGGLVGTVDRIVLVLVVVIAHGAGSSQCSNTSAYK